MRRVQNAFEGCYDAARAAALAGVPKSTVYDWARKDVVVPSVSEVQPKLWSYADLMALRIVHWLRHPKAGAPIPVPASPMNEVRRALARLEADGIDLWSIDDGVHASPLYVDRTGRIVIATGNEIQTTRGQGVLVYLDVLGPFEAEGVWGPDLRRPAPHLRIVPGKVSGEPHLAHSRLTTPAVAALANRGYTVDQIARLYPDEDREGLSEAIELESRLAA